MELGEDLAAPSRLSALLPASRSLALATLSSNETIARELGGRHCSPRSLWRGQRRARRGARLETRGRSRAASDVTGGEPLPRDIRTPPPHDAYAPVPETGGCEISWNSDPTSSGTGATGYCTRSTATAWPTSDQRPRTQNRCAMAVVCPTWNDGSAEGAWPRPHARRSPRSPISLPTMRSSRQTLCPVGNDVAGLQFHIGEPRLADPAPIRCGESGVSVP
jgi:hypothetical protein